MQLRVVQLLHCLLRPIVSCPFCLWALGVRAGCISHSRGGTCLLETMVSVARARGSAYLALTASFWVLGFRESPETVPSVFQLAGFQRCGADGPAGRNTTSLPPAPPTNPTPCKQRRINRGQNQILKVIYVFQVFHCHCLFDWWVVGFCGFGWGHIFFADVFHFFQQASKRASKGASK